ncbi:relaxase/mobilization nuclease domain-containing protein [Ciceribacter azotifigens]|uniref:relaxase/mobilization nuclease domain-containing protein n=1 Tax=Ciceribacter azotifigens TaxID=2069303 RepID=UPI003A855A71
MRFKIPSRQPTSFKASALYLAGRSHGHKPDRVAWMESRNLETDDPGKAAIRMDATAAASTRCKQPQYHFIISFDPNDAKAGKVNDQVMREIAGQTIERMGLAEHQVLIYAHRDTKHPHMHFLVNRVHPLTGRAWVKTNDGPRLASLCREVALECGLNVARDRAAEREKERTRSITDGDYRRSQREEARQLVPLNAIGVQDVKDRLRLDLLEATSWDNLSDRLAGKGYHMVRKGQGLVITDGRGYAKLSDMGRAVRFKELEDRFGERYDLWMADRLSRDELQEGLKGPKVHDGMPPEERERGKRLHEADQLKAERARDPIEHADSADQEYLYWSAMQESYRAAQRRIASEECRKKRLEADLERQRHWENVRFRSFMEALTATYKDVTKARATWLQLEIDHGFQKAADMVKKDATLLGDMRGVDILGGKSPARAAAEKAFRKAMDRRAKWLESRERVGVAMSRIELHRRQLDRAVRDYEMLQHTGGSYERVREIVLEKVKSRARALDRLNGEMIRTARLSDERREQLERAWRKHQERKRELERKRALERGLGLGL